MCGCLNIFKKASNSPLEQLTKASGLIESFQSCLFFFFYCGKSLLFNFNEESSMGGGCYGMKGNGDALRIGLSWQQ